MSVDTLDPFAALGGGLALAGDDAAVAMAEDLTVATMRQRLRAFAQHSSSAVPEAMCAVLDEAAKQTVSFTNAWHQSLGALDYIERIPTRSFVQSAAIELAVYAHECGVKGSWRIEFDEPVDVPVHRRLVRETAAVAVDALGGELRIRARRRGGHEEEWTGIVHDDLWRGGRREPHVALTPLRSEEDRRQEAGEATEAEAIALTRGLALLDRGSPSYAAWVRRIIRCITPLRRTGTEVASWSSAHYPGLVSLTLFDSPIDMTETLVHEASHQYFHLLDRVVPLTNGEELQYSPIKKTLRPLRMILLAYHAFGNISLLLAELRSRGLLSSENYRFMLRDLAEWLPAMSASLRDARALTPAGSALHAALDERVSAVLEDSEAVAP